MLSWAQSFKYSRMEGWEMKETLKELYKAEKDTAIAVKKELQVAQSFILKDGDKLSS